MFLLDVQAQVIAWISLDSRHFVKHLGLVHGMFLFHRCAVVLMIAVLLTSRLAKALAVGDALGLLNLLIAVELILLVAVTMILIVQVRLPAFHRQRHLLAVHVMIAVRNFMLVIM